MDEAEPSNEEEIENTTSDTFDHPKLVAIGASAGGLEALKEFLQAVPSATGCCYVFVQHLDPKHKSMLPELLARCTEMSVLQAEDNLVPEPNSVVLIPPDATLTYEDGLLHLSRPAPPRQHRTPIDSFFESAALQMGEEAVCILLSGTGSDGTHGLSRVKEAGGLTIVQSPKTAKYDSMPRNAIATGFVDYELAPSEMPAVVVEHMRKLDALKASGGIEGLREQMTTDLTKICGILRARTGHNFNDYREGTLLRRIHRRMQVLRIGKAADYVEHLRRDQSEVGKLLRELLISVTAFFRDPQAFSLLSETVIEPLVAGAQPGSTLRLWVPGCATGEEPYTLAMIFQDMIDATSKRIKVQIFATDIDERALDTARRACYAESLLKNVPTSFREKYFRPEGIEYRVIDELREMCIFSLQSVIKDPPFSRIDLISCRNLLIYLKPELQNRLIPVLHYALRPNGALMLGPSENVTKHRGLFDTIDAKWRIFRKKETDQTAARTFPFSSLLGERRDREDSDDVARERLSDKPASPASLAERVILDKLGPAYAVITQDRELLFTGGAIGKFLTVPQGAATQELLSMTRPGIRLDVRAVVHRAVSDGAPARRDGIVFQDGNYRSRLKLDCVPLERAGDQNLYVVAFSELGAAEPEQGDGGQADDSRMLALERELSSTKEHLQTTSEELESSNEELKSVNEELMSMNEELQSSNEELETSKEELQSVNEELETVNSELAAKVDDLGRSNADLQNLLESTQIATLFLDRALRVRRFTPVARELFHLIDRDLGRQISDIAPRLHEPGMDKLARKVLASGRPAQKHVHLKDSRRSFVMRVLPYRASADVLDGVVVTFSDVTEVARAQASAERRAAQQSYLAGLTEMILKGGSPDEIFDVAPPKIAKLLNATFCKILRREPGSEDFRLISGHGFKAGGDTLVPGGGNSQAGYTLRSKKPVIVEDLQSEKRFGGPKLLTDHGVRSGLSTIIAGPNGDWGVLGVHSKEVRSFSGDDIHFIDAVANVFSTGLQREASLRALRESEDRLSAALRAGSLGVHDFDPQTGVVKWDRAVHDLWGVPENEQITYDVFMQGVHPDDRSTVQAAVEAALDPDGAGEYNATFRVINAQDQTMRWVRADGDVTFKNNAAVRLVGTVADVTEQHRNEQHIRILVSEVNHRAKNLLAVVLSIVRQTAKDTPPQEFSEYLTQRIQALAASHDLIIEGNWQSVPIAELVRSQLRHLGDPIARRVRLSGSLVQLTPAAAQGIGLALHELAINAVKYGALSNDHGAVDVAWHRNIGEKSNRFVLTWEETGGPKVSAPAKAGFGTVVTKRLAASTVNGRVDLLYENDGLRWRLEAPEENVVFDPASGKDSARPFGLALLPDENATRASKKEQ